MKTGYAGRLRERILSGLMAAVCFLTALLGTFSAGEIVSRAGTFSGRNIWSGGSEMLFGSRRNYLYRWTDGTQMTFCISPGKHMGTLVSSGALLTHIDDEEIPYVKSREDYEKLAQICSWFDRNGSVYADNATYAAAQTAVWAVMDDGWESADSLARIIEEHITGTYARWEEIRDYVERRDSSAQEMPSWLKPSASEARGCPQGMEQEEGRWSAEFDIKDVPQLASVNWKFDGDPEGWSYRVSDGKIVFSYAGGSCTGKLVSAELPSSLSAWARNTVSLNFYIPQSNEDRNQVMICAGAYTPGIYLYLSPGEGGEVQVKIMKHRETFRSHYQIELEKNCAETGQPLEGAVFRVLEAVSEDPPRQYVREENMTPKPAVWDDFRVCENVVSDENGHVIHRDEKKYEYVRTYCCGHPEPEYFIPEGSEEEELPQEEEEREALEEADRILRKQWEETVRLCEETTDFHSVEEGEGLRMMLEDRKKTYEQFIGLRYDYTFEETQARYGYARHGQHGDDLPIPVVRVSSSEAGGQSEIIERQVVVRDEGTTAGAGRIGTGGEEDGAVQAGTDADGSGMPPAKPETAARKKAVRDRLGGILELKKNVPGRRQKESTAADADRYDPELDPASTADAAKEAGEEGIRYFLQRTADGPTDDEDSVFCGGISLPEAEEDHVAAITAAGSPDRTSYTFHVSDHRTEGELHINKRDLELTAADGEAYDSYGDTQADATLEGAVYGLYAAEDIIHPDGKTGVVYKAGQLTAIASTDKFGDASFLAYTEENGTGPGSGSWVGRPLIAGRYQIREIARSEGYEKTDPGRQETSETGDRSGMIRTEGRADVTTPMSHPVDMHDGSWLEFEVTARDTRLGYDIVVVGFPEGSRFYRSGIRENSENGRVVTGAELVPTGEFERALEGEYRLDENGNHVPVRDEDGNIVYDLSSPVLRTCRITLRPPIYPRKEASPSVDPQKWEDTRSADTEYIREEANSMLSQMGYNRLEPESGSPWSIVRLDGTDNRQIVEEILRWYAENPFWDSGTVWEIREEEGSRFAVLLHDYLRLPGDAFYESLTNQLYIRIPVRVEGGGQRHMFMALDRSEFTAEGGCATVGYWRQEKEIPLFSPMEEYLVPEYEPLYETYRGGEFRLDGAGNKIPVYSWRYIYGEKSQTESSYELEPLEAEYDPAGGSYTIHVENRTDWDETDGSVTETFRAQAPRTEADVNGERIFYSDYLSDVSGAGASAFAALSREPGEDIYIADITYPGQTAVYQDGDAVPGRGTRLRPIPVRERIIRQPVKVIKTVEDDADVSGFRFKVYLKSNLLRLYRDRQGNVVWMDRQGNETDPAFFREAYPGPVPAIFTKVLHRTDPLYRPSSGSVIANARLYEEGAGDPNPGFTSILESEESTVRDENGVHTVEEIRYDKFFDAISVANHDKWDLGKPEFTSFRPLGNRINRSRDAEENALVSDRVRQFAIDWYLDGEAASPAAGETAYGDQFYDEALRRAITKAQDYLKPFFSYDLDEIYAVLWDPDPAGGEDKDRSTLEAREADGKAFCGISRPLPYGEYVVAEQPQNDTPEEYERRRYRIDEPKEVQIPSVYEDPDTDELSRLYIYDADMTAEEMQDRFSIRFCEESDVTEARGTDGFYELYKYGLDIDMVSNGAAKAEKGDYFALTQDALKPFQNYYNDRDNSRDGKVSYYLSEGMSGREKVSAYYRYSSVSEQAGFLQGTRSMTGVLTAYDGKYSSALVPGVPEDAESGIPCARVRFRNRIYKARLRIEKLDSATHENILHDDAVFRIYRAECGKREDGSKGILFYEKDTSVTGSRQFLESMGAKEIRPVYPCREKDVCAGIIPQGTPVCLEENLVSQTDESGVRTGRFLAFTTLSDQEMEDEEETRMKAGLQNTGILQIPQPLEAGAYVIAEAKPPAGYVRSAPTAVEIFGDTVSYVRKAGEEKTASTIYRYPDEGTGDESAFGETARIYVEDAPITLTVEKIKEREEGRQDKGRLDKDGQEDADSTESTGAPCPVTYKVSGRIDGTLAQIGGDPNYEYAYDNGVYLGYAWKKGTLEYLQGRKEAGEDVTIVYNGRVFAGYGYVRRTPDLSDNENPYVPGALMTLYEAIQLVPSGDTRDLAFDGLTVQRNGAGSVTRMYVREGFAGESTRFQKTESGEDTFWDAGTVQRPDTDILYYDLGSLDLFRTETADGRTVKYGFDRDNKKVDINAIEADKKRVEVTDGGHSIFAFRGGIPVLELTGGDFTAISYSPSDKVFEGEFARPVLQQGKTVMSDGVTVYHLDKDGSRDSLVDPYTGMAYAIRQEPASGNGKAEIQVMVWPVNITKDGRGRVIARDKISTFRAAAFGQEDDGIYLTGSWNAGDGQESHPLSTLRKNQAGQNMDGETITTENVGRFEKKMNPVYDKHGLVTYYKSSGKRYEKESALYDRSGSLVRGKASDLAEGENRASYRVQDEQDTDSRGTLHRSGESYIRENTWISGEVSPDDPFCGEMTDGQADLLTRVPSGTYILEELDAPDGYVKAVPQGVIVEEKAEAQNVTVTDYRTRIEIGKADGTDNYVYPVLNMQDHDVSGRPLKLGAAVEGKSSYSQKQLSLYEADWEETDGTGGPRLIKKSETPAASWVTTDRPFLLEGLPAGTYLLEETQTPAGFVSAPAQEIEVRAARQVQSHMVYNDHTKVEIEKYTVDDSGKNLVNGAGFTLYEARTDGEGRIRYDENGIPEYDESRKVDCFVTDDGSKYAGFTESFAKMYGLYGTDLQTLSWEHEGRTYRADRISHTQIDPSGEGGEPTAFPPSAQMMFGMEDGTRIQITAYQENRDQTRRNFTCEYRFDCHMLEESDGRAVSWLTEEGIRRFDYLPVGKAYVLVETEVPPGLAPSLPVLIVPQDTGDIQRYRVINQSGSLIISKTAEGSGKELTGAKLALYAAGADGELIRDTLHLAAVWTTGEDGIYTEEDLVRNRIPEGYSPGDLRPHTLTRLPEGSYWLVELESPGYYTTFQPVKLDYRLEETVKIVRVSDVPAKGDLRVTKTDAGGRPLAGAVFEVSAYRQPDFSAPVFVRQFSGLGADAVLEGLPVGEADENGRIMPYCYRLREIVPPEGFAADPGTYSFEFLPDREGISYSWGENAGAELTVVNEKTRIIINKKELSPSRDGHDAFVEGAILAVYRLEGTGQDGKYIYEEEKPIETWTTSAAEADHVIEGLTAGRTYILAEKEAPEGYGMMDPIAFTISKDGRRISSVSSGLTAITIHSPRAFTLRGRYPVRTEMTLEDAEGDPAAEWTASGNGQLLICGKHIREGEVYSLTERTVYSDGSRETTGRTTRRAGSEDLLLEDRRPTGVRLTLREASGEEIVSYEPDENAPELTVREDESEGELFRSEGTYILEETTFYSDGSARVSSRLAFRIGGNGSVQAVAGYDRPGRVRISKTDITGQEELCGATLQILDEDGAVIEEWISDGDAHTVEADLKPGEEYYLKEILPPDGYAFAETVPFRISGEGVEEKVLMEDRRTRVLISKKEITGEDELEGAYLQILDQDMRIVEEWISGKTPHEITGKLIAGKRYILRESLSPPGYSLAEDVEFTVSEDGSADRVIMRDARIPSDVPGPREPEKPKKYGTVLAEYSPVMIVDEAVPLAARPGYFSPYTHDGQARKVAAALVLALVSLLSAVFWKKRRTGKKKAALLVLFVLFAASVPAAGEKAYAQEGPGAAAESVGPEYLPEEAEVIRRDGKTLRVVPGMQENPAEEDRVFPQECLWEGERCRLISWQRIAVPVPEKEIPVHGSVRYTGVERAADVPGTAQLKAADEESGRSVLCTLPVVDIRESNGRWEDGFALPVTVAGYDLGSFLLGENVIPVKENDPFAGYYPELLALAGLDPDGYRIEDTCWASPPEEGEDGVIFRKALASGKKYVTDVELFCEGTAVFPAGTKIALEAVYAVQDEEPPAPAAPRQTEEEDPSDAATPQDADRGTGVPAEAEDPAGWIRILRSGTGIVIGLGIFIFPLAAICRKKRKNHCIN